MGEFAGRNFARSSLEDLWRHTLSRIPSLFGRLAYLASLRDDTTGFYVHHGLAQRYGREEASRVILLSHETTFVEWVQLNLDQQKADIEQYLAGQKEDWQAVLSNWRRTKRYEVYLPQEITAAEKALYRGDMDLVVETIAREKGETELPDASPHLQPGQ